MAEKSIIIIGAGIAGLTAGIYGRLNGYKTSIFEMGIKPGGLCTAWERQGYIIDGCLHWLVGTSPKSSFYNIWQTVGALDGQKIIDLERFIQVETTAGKTVTLYSDIAKTEKHLKEISPEDAGVIEEMANAVRKFAKLEMPVDKAPELYSLKDNAALMLKMTPYMADFQKWGKLTITDFAARFKSPVLKEAWRAILPLDFSTLFLVYTLGWLQAKNAGYIHGGSMALSLNIEKRYFELGGMLYYGSRVVKILTENGKAIGVRLEDGTEHTADYVISAADGHATIFDMLEGRYIDKTVKEYYQMPIFQPLVYIGLGVNRSFRDVDPLISGLILPLEKPIEIGSHRHNQVGVHIFNFDTSMSEPGKTVLTVSLESDFNYWAELSQDDYKAEKERIAVAVVSALNKRFPGLAEQLEMWNVSTPLTFHRYTGNWQGSYEGFLITPRNMRLQMKKTLPGLTNFYMAGQWVQPGGGLPSALMSGYHVMQIICRQDNQDFKDKV